MILFSLVFLLFAILLVVAGVVTLSQEAEGIIIVGLGVAMLAIPVVSHNSDIVNRDMADVVILEHESHIQSLEGQMSNLPTLQQGIVNADTPVHTVVVELTEARKSLRAAKLDKIDSIKSIEKRKRGVTQWVTWFDGE